MILQAEFVGELCAAELPTGRLARHQLLDRRPSRHQHAAADGPAFSVGADLTDRFKADLRPQIGADEGVIGVVVGGGDRSEEHTSELQSLMRISYAVFCLKKK